MGETLRELGVGSLELRVTKIMKDQNKAYFFAILAVLFWSTIGAAFKLTLEYVSFEELVFYSTLVSLMTLFIIAFLSLLQQ